MHRVIGVIPRIQPQQANHAAHHQSRARQQHQRQRDLAHDQRPADPPAVPIACAGGSAQLEHFTQVGPPTWPRRREAEEQAGGERDHGCDAQDACVERDGFEAGQVRRNKLLKEIETERGDYQARAAAKNGEEQTLGQQLAEHACAAGAQRGAHREFLLARLCARQLKVRHVGGGDAQHERDRTE